MCNFGTSDVQVPYPSPTKTGTSNGQALVPNYKPLQTPKNNFKQKKNIKKQLSAVKTMDEQEGTVPNRDNLRTSRDKDYNQPL